MEERHYCVGASPKGSAVCANQALEKFVTPSPPQNKKDAGVVQALQGGTCCSSPSVLLPECLLHETYPWHLTLRGTATAGESWSEGRQKAQAFRWVA